LPSWGAVLILAGAAIVGIVGTLYKGQDPGSFLGLLVVAGAVIAALAIRQRAVYQIIPLPALTYLIAAVITGGIHDRAIDTSKAQIGINFLQWIAGGFLEMSAATILVVVIAGARWVLRRQLVSGRFPVSEQRSAPDRAPRRRPAPETRADRDNWADAEPWEGRQPPAPRRNRDQRDWSDYWDDRNPRG
jgi:hypothetical protein